MYTEAGVDLATFREVVADVPTGGFFCNGEVASMGVSGLVTTDSRCTTHLHGFTSVWAMFYDTSPAEESSK